MSGGREPVEILWKMRDEIREGVDRGPGTSEPRGVFEQEVAAGRLA